MVGRRHAAEEVTAKLAKANELAGQGRTQREIAQALGVSIMTYHRWRKAWPERPSDVPPATTQADPGARPEYVSSDDGHHYSDSDRLRDLESENERLRRLVVDLLLEKTKVESALREKQMRMVRRMR